MSLNVSQKYLHNWIGQVQIVGLRQFTSQYFIQMKKLHKEN